MEPDVEFDFAASKKKSKEPSGEEEEATYYRGYLPSHPSLLSLPSHPSLLSLPSHPSLLLLPRTYYHYVDRACLTTIV